MSLAQLEAMVKQSVILANQAIYAIASEQDDLHGMGTTVVVALATEQSLIIAHIGDSRLYLVHNGEIRQVTEDHSLVNELVKSGQITYEESLHHPRKNVVTRALGTEPYTEPDLQHVYWDVSDMALLCSDGLSNLVTPEQVVETLSLPNDLDFKVKQLIELALKAGGDDNISVALLWNTIDDQHGREGME
jgi:serine/threonine protein phosphatase PrpC